MGVAGAGVCLCGGEGGVAGALGSSSLELVLALLLPALEPDCCCVCAKRTPVYMTELISRETTRELSPESPERYVH